VEESHHNTLTSGEGEEEWCVQHGLIETDELRGFVRYAEIEECCHTYEDKGQNGKEPIVVLDVRTLSRVKTYELVTHVVRRPRGRCRSECANM
jgi:hypothetical protein